MNITQVCEEMVRTGTTRWLNWHVVPRDEYIAMLIMRDAPQHHIDDVKANRPNQWRWIYGYQLYAGTKYGDEPEWRDFPLHNVRGHWGWTPWGYGSRYVYWTFWFTGPDGYQWQGYGYGNGYARVRRPKVQTYTPEHLRALSPWNRKPRTSTTKATCEKAKQPRLAEASSNAS